MDLDLVMPLWKQDSRKLLQVMIDSGLEISIVSAEADLMGKEWLGRNINEKFISDLERLNPSIDACGENGEFHTLVTNAPVFQKKIQITKGDKVLRDGYWYWDIRGWRFQEK